jgi:hypothetical protein
MRSRTWIHVLALIGVLLHAGAVARHTGILLGAALQGNSLAADLGVICHGGANAPGPELPAAPAPSSPQTSCPICMGLAPVAALLAAAESLAAPATGEIALQTPAPSPGLLQTPFAACPPARGPPTRA